MYFILQIVLIPKGENLPFYSGSLENANRRQEYSYFRCSDAFYDGAYDMNSISEQCLEEHLDSIGYYVYKQAFCEL